ncbi:uncharacterized protein LOC133717558 [Rosa rugosa]|uniref:uncharacterized protein LOC133717558 n=1 Tax=Rosa rugosa TaxID=74645 RepID=UPI002B40567F|nr:uncharacterized protein LOC133717558 [Rosa rugosa]XP_062000264.1 uncharacterized protein LOC133717558 [Rosa rugosa]XP_062000265.1 uncharacterized protein LOC133717558 [Rosa rugosa]
MCFQQSLPKNTMFISTILIGTNKQMIIVITSLYGLDAVLICLFMQICCRKSNYQEKLFFWPEVYCGGIRKTEVDIRVAVKLQTRVSLLTELYQLKGVKLSNAWKKLEKNLVIESFAAPFHSDMEISIPDKPCSKTKCFLFHRLYEVCDFNLRHYKSNTTDGYAEGEAALGLYAEPRPPVSI